MNLNRGLLYNIILSIALAVSIWGGQRKVDILTDKIISLKQENEALVLNIRKECAATISTYDQDVTATKKENYRCERSLEYFIRRENANLAQALAIVAQASQYCPKLRDVEFVRELAR